MSAVWSGEVVEAFPFGQLGLQIDVTSGLPLQGPKVSTNLPALSSSGSISCFVDRVAKHVLPPAFLVSGRRQRRFMARNRRSTVESFRSALRRITDARTPMSGHRRILDAVPGERHILTDLSLSALPITETEERLIAAAANIGEISRPKNG